MPRTITITTSVTKTLGQVLYETMRKHAPHDEAQRMMPWETLEVRVCEAWECAAAEFASVVEANAVPRITLTPASPTPILPLPRPIPMTWETVGEAIPNHRTPR